MRIGQRLLAGGPLGRVPYFIHMHINARLAVQCPLRPRPVPSLFLCLGGGSFLRGPDEGDGGQ